jgi:hypothetical protein
MSIIVRPAFEAYAKSIDREWSNDRAQTVGASEVGKCARSIYWAKNEGDEFFGAHRDEDYEDTFGHKVRGKVFEDAFFVPAMQAAFGERLLFSGEQQRTFRKGFLTATPDGYLTYLTFIETLTLGIPSDYTAGLTIDCKSIDPRVTALPKPEHVYQVQLR